MALLLHVSDLDHAILLRCEGRIVCGPESEELEKRVHQLLRAMRHVVLDLSGVTFVDSGGLGLLVRLMTSARRVGGDVKVAAPSPQVAKLLETTGLTRVFHTFSSSEDALLGSLSQSTLSAEKGKRVLCVDPSCDVLAFVRTVLQTRGYLVLTTDNLFDANILLRAAAPDALLLGPNLDPQRATGTLRERPARTAVVALGAQFDHLEAAEASALLLDRIQKAAA